MLARVYFYAWQKHGRFPNEIRALPIKEQAIVIQFIIEEMSQDVEMIKELKGRTPQMSLKQLLGNRSMMRGR